MDRPVLEALSPARNARGTPRVGERGVYFASAGGVVSTRVYARAELPSGFAAHGPALIEEYGSTTVVAPGDAFRVGALGEIEITLSM
jgi:N-methylhydantoinase A